MAEGRRLTPVAIRRAGVGDAAEISRLSAQLGYPAPVEAFEDRLRKLLASPQHAVFVADAGDGRLAGFIAVERRLIIEYGERAEIAALVVDAQIRRGGVGRALVAEAERWAADLGLHDMVVRSNAVRAESHPFYESQGYGRIKTQHVYRKPL